MGTASTIVSLRAGTLHELPARPATRPLSVAAGHGRLRLVSATGATLSVLRVGPGSPIGSIATAAPERHRLILQPEAAIRLEAAAPSAASRQQAHHLAWFLAPTLRRCDGVVAHRYSDATQSGTLLLGGDRSAPLLVGDVELLVWTGIDGRRDASGITTWLADAHGMFVPHLVVRALERFAQAGLIEPSPVRVRPAPASLPASLAGLANIGWTFRGVDRYFQAIHDRLGRHFFTVPFQVVLGCLLVAAFAVLHDRWAGLPEKLSALAPWTLTWLLAIIPAQTLLHELAHALAVKHAGRRVRGVGIGFYWFGLTAHVDTTEMWLASRRQRLVATLAGPWCDGVLGSLCLLGALATDGPLSLVLTLAGLTCGMSIMVNLNPLLEMDGYYLLIDLIGRPSLRRDAWRFLVREVARADSRSACIRARPVEFCFGLASLGYLMGLLICLFWSFFTFAEAWLLPVIGSALAHLALASAVAAIVASTAATIWRDTRTG